MKADLDQKLAAIHESFQNTEKTMTLALSKIVDSLPKSQLPKASNFISKNVREQRDVSSCSESSYEDYYTREEFEIICSLKRKEVLQLSKIINVKDDGNCFYRALSFFLYRNEAEHERLRNEINKWALNNLKHFYSDGLSEENLREYFLKQTHTSEYAEKQSIMASAYSENIVILLWADVSDFKVDELFYQFFPLRLKKTYDKNEVMLLYLKNNHYQLLEFNASSSCLLQMKPNLDVLSSLNSDKKFSKRIYSLSYEDIYKFLRNQMEGIDYYPE